MWHEKRVPVWAASDVVGRGCGVLPTADMHPTGVGFVSAWVLDITLDKVEIAKALMGFSITYDAADRDATAHACDIRVAYLRGADQQSQIYAGDFHVPTVSPGTPLHYLFAIQFSSVRVVRVEVLSHYGSLHRVARPAIELHTSDTAVHTSEAYPSVVEAFPETTAATLREHSATVQRIGLL